MKQIESITVFTGNDYYTVDLSNYEEIVDESQEFPDHTEVSIAFVDGGKVVRRLWNPSCDIAYKPEAPK
jgi:hypothetical protein